MKTTLLLGLLLVSTALVPAAASAAKSCQELYYQCLNDSWDTRGLERIAADLECAIRYAGCIKKILI